MTSSALYLFIIEVHNHSKDLTMLHHVPQGENILEVGMKSLQETMFWEKNTDCKDIELDNMKRWFIENKYVDSGKLQNVTNITQLIDIIIPMYIVYDHYTITKIYQMPKDQFS